MPKEIAGHARSWPAAPRTVPFAIGRSSRAFSRVHQLDGTHIVTIEGVAHDGALSPIQQAMVECHGSQCGFCTPGFVNSLTGLFECDNPVDDDALRTNLAGNLCRCTGYEPILAAGLSVDPANVRRLSSLYPSRVMVEELAACAGRRHPDRDGGEGFLPPDSAGGGRRCFARASPARSSPPAPPSWASQRNKRGLEPPAILSLAGISELAKITRDDGVLSVGANVTWARLEAFAQDALPEIHALTQRFGSPQIRNVATLVGNIAHGSPVADSLCFLMIVEAELELISTRGSRRVAIKDFHTGPKQTVVAPDEIITRVLIPLTAPDEIVKLYKISKRKEMDVSTFRAGIRISRQRRADRVGGDRLLRRRADRAQTAPDGGVSGRPAVLGGDLSRGGSARSCRGRADHRRSRVARVPPPARGEHPRQVLSRNGRSGASGEWQGGADRGRARCRKRPSRRPARLEVAPTSRPRLTSRARRCISMIFRRFATSFWSSLSAARWPMRGSLRSTLTAAAHVEGIAAVFTAADVPGDNHFGPIFHDEELLAAHECHYIGQPIVVLAGESRAALRAARAAIRLEVEALPAVLSIDDAIAGGHFIGPTRRLARGDAQAALARAEHVIEGTFRTGGQEHFYLETQAALAIPGEGGQMTVHSSTQNPSEIQAVVAHCLGLAPEHGRLHLHADGGRVSEARSRRPPIPPCWRPWSPTRPAGRHASFTRETWTCGSPGSGIRICAATAPAFARTGGSRP